MTDRDWLGYCCVLVLFGVLIGGILFVGVPWLWGFAKPLLHAATA